MTQKSVVDRDYSVLEKAQKEIEAKNRDTVEKAVRAMLEQRVNEAVASLKEFNTGCTECRAFKGVWLKEAGSTGNLLRDFGFREESDDGRIAMYCNTCKRCVWTNVR